MSRFTGVTYDAERGMVEIGVGLTWDQVYEKLEPMGVMVAGGRTPGIGKSVPFCRMNIDLDTKVSEGVGGLSLGGGYSWKNQSIWTYSRYHCRAQYCVAFGAADTCYEHIIS